MRAPTKRGRLRQILDVVAVLPVFLVSPFLRRRHLSWGATEEEVAAPMPGDDLVPVSHFTPTRAITIDARPEEVWPWLLQVGIRRAGFYSYDLLDNLGAPSSEVILAEWQGLRVGDVAAPMTDPPTAATSFVLAAREENRSLLWAKPDSTWAWRLVPLEGGRTRLVTRVRQRYAPRPGTILTIVLMEFGDFAMMRKMLRGIKRRAERLRASQERAGGRARAADLSGRKGRQPSRPERFAIGTDMLPVIRGVALPAASYSVTIDRPTSEVFDFLADPRNDLRWRPGVMSMNHVSGSGVGAVYQQTVAGPGGRAVHADIEITEFDRPRLIAFRTIAGPVRPVGRYVLSSAGDGTRLDFSLEATVGGLKKLFSALVQRTMEGEVAAIGRLEQVLESH